MTENDSTHDTYVEQQDGEAVEETSEAEEIIDTDETEDDESQEDSEPTAEELLKAKDAEIAKLRRILSKKNGKPVERATEAPQKQVSKEPQYLTRDEGILLAQGYDEKDIATLKAISDGKKISILAAKDDELFLAYTEKKKADERKAKSGLGASKGSGSVKPQTAPKTREEHMDLWKKKMGLQ
jgi:hypothetical protein